MVLIAIGSLYCEGFVATSTPTTTVPAGPTVAPTVPQPAPTSAVPTPTLTVGTVTTPTPALSPAAAETPGAAAPVDPTPTVKLTPQVDGSPTVPIPAATPVSIPTPPPNVEGTTPRPDTTPVSTPPAPVSIPQETFTPRPTPTGAPVPDATEAPPPEPIDVPPLPIAEPEPAPTEVIAPSPTVAPTPIPKVAPTPTPTISAPPPPGAPAPAPTAVPTPGTVVKPTPPPIERTVQIVMEPATANMSISDNGDFTVRVLTGGVKVTGVTVSMTFDPQFLKVVDALPQAGTQIRPHPDNNMADFAVENEADNANGTIRFSVDLANGLTSDFNLATITFGAKGEPTPPGAAAAVAFVVQGEGETVVSNDSTSLLLKNTSDFTGSQVTVDERAVEIVMLPTDMVADAGSMSLGSTKDFSVRVLTHGVEVTAVSILVSFDPLFLEVVDRDRNRATRVTPHPNTPFPDDLPGNFVLDNEVDNSTGTLRYTVGSVKPAVGDFGLVLITFHALGVTAQGPTEVRFLVEDGNKTAVAKSGQQLLKEREDFVGAAISISQ